MFAFLQLGGLVCNVAPLAEVSMGNFIFVMGKITEFFRGVDLLEKIAIRDFVFLFQIP